MRFEIDFKDSQPLIKDYDLILFEGTGFISRLIQFGTGSRKSHVGVARWAGPVLCVFESTPKNGIKDEFAKSFRNGCQTVELASRIRKYGKGKVIWRPIEGNRTTEQIEELELIRKETSGIVYEKNVREFVGAAWHIIINRENRGSIFCSELVAHVLKRAHILCENDPSSEYTPEDFSIEADRKLRYCNGFTPSPIEYVLTTEEKP